MTINNIKDLEAVIKLCRSKGVSELSINGLSIKLGDKPERTSNKEPSADNGSQDITSAYTDEQLLLWSSSAPIDTEDLNG